MNALTTTDAKPLSLTDLAISAPLWTLLSSQRPADEEIAEIARDQSLRVQAKAAVAGLERLASPCGDRAVQLALQPLVLVYGVAEAARVAAFWKPYRILADLPHDALTKAVDEYTGLATSEFFPKPGPLMALGNKHAETIRKAASRAKRAAVAAIPAPTPDPAANHDEIVRMARETASRLQRAKTPTRPTAALPTIAGKADETGVTPAMKALLERQRGAEA